MIKRVLTVIFLIATVISFATGCKSEKVGPTNPNTSTVTTATTPAGATRQLLAASLIGQWSSEDAAPKMIANITDGHITVNWVDEDLTMIYWNGTFYEASPLGSVVTSERIDGVRMLSDAKTKQFSYDGQDTITFTLQVDAFALTKDIHLMRGA